MERDFLFTGLSCFKMRRDGYKWTALDHTFRNITILWPNTSTFIHNTRPCDWTRHVLLPLTATSQPVTIAGTRLHQFLAFELCAFSSMIYLGCSELLLSSSRPSSPIYGSPSLLHTLQHASPLSDHPSIGMASLPLRDSALFCHQHRPRLRTRILLPHLYNL